MGVVTQCSNRLSPAPRVLKVYGSGTSALKAYGVICDNIGEFMTRLCCAIEAFMSHLKNY